MKMLNGSTFWRDLSADRPRAGRNVLLTNGQKVAIGRVASKKHMPQELKEKNLACFHIGNDFYTRELNGSEIAGWVYCNATNDFR